jgi:hypothetical protein
MNQKEMTLRVQGSSPPEQNNVLVCLSIELTRNLGTNTDDPQRRC